MIDRQLSIIVSLLTGKHLKRDRLLKDGLFPSSVLFFHRKSIQGCSLVVAIGQGSALATTLLVYFMDYVIV